MSPNNEGLHISRLVIRGFKRFGELDIELHPRFSVIVGDNETGKSSILEAIALVLKGQYEGRLIHYAIDPYIFNAELVAAFFSTLRAGGNQSPPEIVIEAYLAPPELPPELEKLRGTHNLHGENCPGLKMLIAVEPDYVAELADYARDEANPVVLPVEYYNATWRSFAGNRVSSRGMPFRTAVVDPLTMSGSRAPGRYVTQVVGDVLSEGQRRDLALEYRKLRHSFAQEPGVKAVNKYLAEQGGIGLEKRLNVQMDMSARATWEQAIIPHLDELPYYCAGKGEQCRIQFRLAIAGADRAHILLVEEPENHLSHPNLSSLLDDIRKECAERQVIIATHSAFVLNKLGIDNLILLSAEGETAKLTDLDDGTRDYFMKLPGFDTLRLILASRCILVEGPSDELVVQKAYYDLHSKSPLEDGVDVISVGSLAFKRFLEIARILKLDVRVVTDNDGQPEAVKERYSEYSDSSPSIMICYDDDATCPSLEEQLLKANSREVLNGILAKNYDDDDGLVAYMKRHKTECALRLFESDQSWVAPAYIHDALAH